MKDNTCPYCTTEDKPELMAAIGLPIADLRVSTLYLFKEQSHPGRCIVAYKDHVSELPDIPLEERIAFMEDVTQAANAIHKTFHPDKVNYGAYGDLVRHLHFHLVPKYKDEFEWGDIFAMNPHAVELNPAEYEEMIAKIKFNLDF